MAFRKKRSRYFGIFSSYSLLLHLGGFLAIIILTSSPPPKSSPPTITVRLVDSQAPTLEALPIKGTPKPKTLASTQRPSIPSLKPLPASFQVIPPSDRVATLPQPDSVGTTPQTHSLAQVAINTLIPVNIAQNVSQMKRASTLTSLPTRTLIDHKAGHSILATTPAKVLYKQTPPYPKIARELGLEGKTLLRVEILQDGRPGTVKVRESCGHTLLDEAAAKAIKEWKFSPAHDGLFAVRSIVDLPIRFSLQS